ncbi:MAG: protein-glutamate O-methyltransferase [Rhodospirillaceae bacterium]|nr:protein-glutamate O-methyltransferase [Rhodospirillaceae bacterium]
MKADDFNMFQSLLKQRSGLVLSRDKAYLLESRLMPVARKWSLRGLDELAQAVRTKKDERLVKDITEAMTTNESSFFRDTKPFEQFRTFTLPALLKGRTANRKIRIWSAACSSGQEPYSLSMLLKEEGAKLSGWSIEIVATDISSEILAKAKAGVYTQFEVQRGLPITHLVKYFRQRSDKWELTPDIRSMVTFREFNLLEDLRPLGQFDVIFCRNVLIYFDQPTKTRVLEGMSRLLASDGVLFLGGAETVLGITDKFKPVDGQRGVYQLSGGAGTATTPVRPTSTGFSAGLRSVATG